MTPRQRYALTHPLDEFHMDRIAHAKRIRTRPDGTLITTILAVDR